MSQKQISQWRSVGFAFLVLAVLATVLLLVVLRGKASPDAVAMFGSLTTFAWIATLAAFGKSLGEKATVGNGLKGMARVLLTDEKPPDPPPAAGFARTRLLVVLGAVAVLVILALIWSWLWILYVGIVVGAGGAWGLMATSFRWGWP